MRGGGGGGDGDGDGEVKNSQNPANVVYGWPPAGFLFI